MDMSQYLDIFLEESIENLQTLNEGILELEKNAEDKETINSIFRVAHTLKGMAGSMGFTTISELTHKMENVLDQFRNDELKVTTDVITILFKCLDTLEKMVKNIQNGVNEEVDIHTILDELTRISVSGQQNEQQTIAKENKLILEYNNYETNLIKDAHEKGYHVFNVIVTLHKDCVLKSARAFLVYKNLEESGEIIKSLPPTQELEEEKFDMEFILTIVTKLEKEIINKKIIGISEIESVQIDEVDAQTVGLATQMSAGSEPAPKNDVKTDVVAAAATVTTGKPSEMKTPIAGKEDDKISKKSHQSVRVDLDRLDNFMTLVGELVIHRTRLEQISNMHKLSDLNETLEQVGRITLDLQDLVMKIRMLPVERVFNRFPRMIRDLSQDLGKEIELIIEGEETELDRTVIDEIGEPLVHLIRNAADHGIETPEERKAAGKNPKGTVKLIAYQEGNKAIIKIEDDGKGINIEKIKSKANSLGISTDGMSDADIRNLIFMQGFSTSEVVSDVSGRGVGMDVVKTKVSAIGGIIETQSELGKGTTIIIRLPLTLSIIQALLVKCGDEALAIALGFIDKVININVHDIKKTNNNEVIIYRGNVVPIVRIANKLMVQENDNDEKFAVIVKVGEKTVGLLVDSLLGQQEIVIKSIGKTLQSIKEYVGATILGDGLVTLILDVAALV